MFDVRNGILFLDGVYSDFIILPKRLPGHDWAACSRLTVLGPIEAPFGQDTLIPSSIVDTPSPFHSISYRRFSISVERSAFSSKSFRDCFDIAARPFRLRRVPQKNIPQMFAMPESEGALTWRLWIECVAGRRKKIKYTIDSTLCNMSTISLCYLFLLSIPIRLIPLLMHPNNVSNSHAFFITRRFHPRLLPQLSYFLWVFFGQRALTSLGGSGVWTGIKDMHIRNWLTDSSFIASLKVKNKAINVRSRSPVY